MALTYAGLYSDVISYASGRPAAGISVTVRPSGSQSAATLYTSRTKGATASNPATTDASGNLTFYVAPGLYDLVAPTGTVTVTVPPDPAETADIPVVGQNPFSGRRWTALGTSITHGGMYTSPLATALGLTLTDLAITGATLSRGITNDPAYFGNGQITDQLYSIPSNAELITLEAGVNDFRASVRLGQLGDTDPTTFYGALWNACSFVQTYRPNALMMMFTPYGFTEATFAGTATTPNGYGRYLRDFQRAIVEVGGVFGVPVIRVGEESGIGAATASTWMSDGLHINTAGGQRYADYVAPKVRQVFTGWPPAVSTPSLPANPTYSATNLVANGDFETNVNSWSFQNGASFVQSASPDPYVTGTKSAKLTTVSAVTTGTVVAYTFAIASIVVGNTYRARVYVRMPGSQMPSAGPPLVTCRLNYMDGASATTLAINTSRYLVADEWVEYQMAGTVPVGTTQCNIQVRYPAPTAAGFYCLVDAATLNLKTN